MSSLLRIVVCCLSLSAACGVLAADSAPAAAPANSRPQAPLPAAAERAPPLLQRPNASKLKHVDTRYAMPTVAHRRADGSLEIRNAGPLQTEMQNDR
ncbi:hypothetical protein DFR29_109146 [Tahibacter aquaticus]|uniref:Uncharacterized protein n=1 Tax=Tahibacter aquaticus TaxID=520092 RepID=A0A4R6YU83_9GAMM|nr:hypothetical protein [Tahibacter aquaticus]TDR42090.1 hypothetical protein DFR29_109146 [Tahibacter aquaticus]